MAHPHSLTGQYLSGRLLIEVPTKRGAFDPQKVLTLKGAKGNNLKDVTALFPVGLLTCVTGVSGSGKSTLVNDTLFRIAARELNGASQAAAPFEKAEGLDHFDKVVDIDQSPIGRTPRSNPATYTRGSVAGILSGTLQLQRQRRTLRGLCGRWRDQGRNAFPTGPLRQLRCLSGQAL